MLIVRGNSMHMEVLMSEILISWENSCVLYCPTAVSLSSRKQLNKSNHDRIYPYWYGLMVHRSSV